MLGESWSSRESLKVLTCEGVGVEGLMHSLLNVSSFISILIFVSAQLILFFFSVFPSFLCFSLSHRCSAFITLTHRFSELINVF